MEKYSTALVLAVIVFLIIYFVWLKKAENYHPGFGKPLNETVYTSGASLRDDTEFTSTDQGRHEQL